MGMWSAILCGSIAAACSGTIETPTEEFPARSGNSAAADDDDDAPAPRPQAPAPNDDDDDRPTAPVASNDDDDPLPPAGDDDEEEPAPPAAEPPAEEPAAGALSFEADIQPIFADTCGPCHGAAAQSGVNIGDDDIEAAFENAVDREDRVFDRIESGTMPPGCSGPPGSGAPCMSEEDFAAVEAWYEGGTPP